MKIVLDDGAYEPVRSYKTDAGLDLRAPYDVWVNDGSYAIIDTGVHVELPEGTAGMLKSKSGLNVKHGIVSEGVIDCGYTGSIIVKLYNHSKTPYLVRAGDKITQLVIVPVVITDIEIVESLKKKDRGNNGIGSTGK